MDVLASEEIEVLMAYLNQKGNDKHSLIISLALFSGLRSREIASLKWKDVLKGFRVRDYFVPSGAKMGSKMVAVMNSYSAEILRRGMRNRVRKNEHVKRGQIALIEGNPFVLGHKYTDAGIWLVWRRIQVKLFGCSFYRFHDLRHTAITNFYKLTGDVELTRQFARHKSYSTTRIYIHAANRERVKSVVEQVAGRFMDGKVAGVVGL